MKIPFREIEEARKDPGAFRIKLEKMQAQSKTPFIPQGYFGQLRNAIYKYHSSKDPVEGFDYLKLKLSKFNSEYRKQEMEKQYNWYVKDYIEEKRKVFAWRQNVSVRLNNDLIIAGEVNRLDINIDGGYFAWLFLAQKPEMWSQELRMALLQDRIANSVLHIDACKIIIGVYCFQEQFIDQHCYSTQEIQEAYAELNKLALNLGLI